MENEKIVFLKNKGVDIDTAINNMGDFETYDELLSDFYESLPNQASEIDNYKNMSDMPNYAILVHALKSNARSFGFNQLGEVAYAHELKSKENDINYVNENYALLLQEIEKVKNIIAEYKNI